MQVESRFRIQLGIRIGFGIFLFFVTFCYIIYTYLYASQESINPLTVLAAMLCLFLIYASPDVFRIYKLTITEEGIEKTLVITGKKRFITFDKIYNIKREKIKMRNSNGFHFSTVMFENNQHLVISPDHFDNYKEIIMAISRHLK